MISQSRTLRPDIYNLGLLIDPCAPESLRTIVPHLLEGRTTLGGACRRAHLDRRDRERKLVCNERAKGKRGRGLHIRVGCPSPQNSDPKNKSLRWSPGGGCPEPRVQGHTWMRLGKEVWAQHSSLGGWALPWGSSPRGWS